MRNSRRAGQFLLVGILLPLVILGLHPTAHDLTADAGGRIIAINHFVHGIAIASLPLILLGLIGLSQYLEWTAAAVGGLVIYCFATLGNLVAALMSGFVASEVIGQMQADDEASAATHHMLLHYTGYVNQAFAKLAVLAAGVALLLWSLEIIRTRRLSRLSAIVGLGVGVFLILGIPLGQLHLDVRGIILVTALQAVWMVLIGFQLLRVPPATQG
jgi:hypothetical protein